MLDTIILQLERENFTIQDYYKFGTTEKKMFDGDVSFRYWINNPTSQDKQKGIYMPRLTIFRRGLKYFLQIEFSAPKLIFGNNLDELNETDFSIVVKTLQDKLLKMGVMIFTRDIEEAQILSFHPSKNIILNNNFTVGLAIRELSKIDISKRFDIDKKVFRNNGEVLQFYTGENSLVIYDKIKDITKPAKRATDKDKTIQQLSLFEPLKKKKLEVFRFEIRFKKKKMNDILKKLGNKINPQFKDIFNKELCKKILNLYWNDFFGKNKFIFSINSNPQKVLQIITSKFPNMKTTKALKIVGLYCLCKDDEGIRGFRQIIDNNGKKKSNWPTVKKYMKVLENEIFIFPNWQFLNDIEQELNKFESLKFDKKDIYLPI